MVFFEEQQGGTKKKKHRTRNTQVQKEHMHVDRGTNREKREEKTRRYKNNMESMTFLKLTK